MSGKSLIYWDACIFLAHLKDETREDPNDMLGVNELATLFDQGQLDLATSVITFTEVLESSIPSEEYIRFRKIFSRKNSHLIDVHREIAEISHKIRNFYYDPTGKKPTVHTPDAIHLATAIWFECSVLYTFDGEGGRGLLQLSQPIADVYSMPIQRPAPTQPPQLPLDLPEE